MTLPPETREVALAQIDRFCEDRIPADLRDTVHLEREVRGDAVTIVERRPPWREHVSADWTRSAIAQLRYDSSTGAWSLYWRDSRERWLPYDGPAPADDVAPLLVELAIDSDGCFWG